MATTLFQVAAAVGFGLLGQFTSKKPPRQPTIGFDEQPTATARRGDYIPVAVGRVRLPATALFAGDRVTTGGGEPGKRGGGGGGSGLMYHEAAWHGVCVGPVNALHDITVDDKVLWDGDGEPLVLDGVTVLSGAALQLKEPHPGTMYWYFGDAAQTVNTRLGEGNGTGSKGVGIASRWPNLCYAEARRVNIGENPVWPNLLFGVEARHDGGLMSAPAWIDESSLGAKDDGNNPAHAMVSLLTSRHPRGCGLKCSRLLCDAFEALAELFADERVPVNFNVANAATGVQTIAAMMADLGVLVPEAAGKLAPRAIRALASGDIGGLPLLTRDSMGPAPATISRPYGLSRSRVSFEFPDRAIGYRSQPLRRDDDATVDVVGRIRPRVVRIATITDKATASKVADRRADEEQAPKTTISGDALRAGVAMLPGDQFRLQELGEPERLCVVSSIRPEFGRHSARIGAMLMRYGQSTAVGAGVPTDPPGPADLDPDLIFTPQELPYAIVKSDTVRLATLRVRSGGASTGARIIASSNGTSYIELGFNPGYCVGGVLTNDLPAGRTIIGLDDDGPVIAEYNEDLAELEDLSDADLRNDWLAGRQAALIGVGDNAEIVFVQSKTSIGGGDHRLNGLIRGRMDTDVLAWPAGTPVLIFTPGGRVTSMTSASLLSAGSTVHVKSLPRSGAGEVDLADVTAQTRAIVGRAARPLPVFNLRANGAADGLATYPAAGDIDLTWSYRVRNGLGGGAGEGMAGSATGPKPPREGPFVVELWTSGVLRRTLTLDSDATDSVGVIYLNADNASDHSGTPAAEVEARVYHTRGAYRSRVRTITVEKI